MVPFYRRLRTEFGIGGLIGSDQSPYTKFSGRMVGNAVALSTLYEFSFYFCNARGRRLRCSAVGAGLA